MATIYLSTASRFEQLVTWPIGVGGSGTQAGREAALHSCAHVYKARRQHDMKKCELIHLRYWYWEEDMRQAIVKHMNRRGDSPMAPSGLT